MAGFLNSVYLVVVALVAVAGSVFAVTAQSTESSPRWLELSALGGVLLFILALTAQLLV